MCNFVRLHLFSFKTIDGNHLFEYLWISILVHRAENFKISCKSEDCNSQYSNLNTNQKKYRICTNELWFLSELDSKDYYDRISCIIEYVAGSKNEHNGTFTESTCYSTFNPHFRMILYAIFYKNYQKSDYSGAMYHKSILSLLYDVSFYMTKCTISQWKVPRCGLSRCICIFTTWSATIVVARNDFHPSLYLMC